MIALCGRPDAEPQYLNYKNEKPAVFSRDDPSLIEADEVLIQALKYLSTIKAECEF